MHSQALHHGKPLMLRRDQINDILWDNCIKSAINRRIYAYTWYLDAVTDGHWCALVDSEDYQMIFPFYPKRKWGLPYVFSPTQCQQLGVFTQGEINVDQEKMFYDTLRRKYPIINITGFHDLGKNFNVSTNHVLLLAPGYESISASYNRRTKRNLKSTHQQSYSIESSSDIVEVMDFLRLHHPYTFSKVEERRISALLNHANDINILDIQWLLQGGIKKSLGVGLKDGHRYYYLLQATETNGRKANLGFALIDYLIKSACSEYKIFDFTGSNMPDIAARNLGFGAVEEKYYRFKSKWW
jgi:hypothetical protein